MNIPSSRPAVYIATGMVAALLPLIVKFQQSTLIMLNMVVVYSIAALGFNILLGYGGQISLGHAAFMGLGAYLSAYLNLQLHLPFLLCLLLSGIIPMVIGLVLGLVALRLEGHYLAIATLGFGVAVQQVFKEWIAFTNGYSGVNASYPVILSMRFRSRESYFMLAIAILIMLSIFAYNVLRGKTGRALIAMRDSEHAAQAMGISLFKYKLTAFAISAFYAGIAGSLYMHLIRFTEPNQWGIELSLNLLAMVVIGGLASVGGSIAGAAFITIIPELIKEVPLLAGIKNLSSIFTGISLVLIVMFFPRGLIRIGTGAKLLLQNSLKRKAV